jgi:hypothetical protein
MVSGTMGTAGSVAAQGALLLDSVTSKWNVVLPSGTPFVSLMNYSAVNGTISAGSGLFGSSGFAISSVLAETVAAVAGHFTSITVTTLLGGTCTTVPQFNVFDGASNTGTAVSASASTQTKGTGTTQAETQTFAAGDHIGIYISTAGATCIADDFAVSAQYSTP